MFYILSSGWPVIHNSRGLEVIGCYSCTSEHVCIKLNISGRCQHVFLGSVHIEWHAVMFLVRKQGFISADFSKWWICFTYSSWRQWVQLVLTAFLLQSGLSVFCRVEEATVKILSCFCWAVFVSIKIPTAVQQLDRNRLVLTDVFDSFLYLKVIKLLSRESRSWRDSSAPVSACPSRCLTVSHQEWQNRYSLRAARSC